MRQERHVNDAQTTLNGGIDASTTTIVVTDGSVFPSEGDFRIIIDSELMLVTARATNSLTVVRAYEGTTGVSHLTLADVRAVITAGALDQFWSDFNPMYLPNALPKRIFSTSGAPIGQSSFTWYNQSTSTSEDLADGSIMLTTPSYAGGAWRGKYVTPPATPWALRVAVSTLWLHTGEGSDYPQCGITVENSGNGRLITLAYHFRGSYSPGLQISKQNSYSSYNSDYRALRPLASSGDLIWLRYADDGVNHKQHVSIDGINWSWLNTVSRTNWLSNGGDRVGFGFNSSGNDFLGLDHKTFIKHWDWS